MSSSKSRTSRREATSSIASGGNAWSGAGTAGPTLRVCWTSGSKSRGPRAEAPAHRRPAPRAGVGSVRARCPPAAGRARLDVANTILSVAEQFTPWMPSCGPATSSIRPNQVRTGGGASRRCSRVGQAGIRPMVLLPGNHNPVKVGSVFHPDHCLPKTLA